MSKLNYEKDMFKLNKYCLRIVFCLCICGANLSARAYASVPEQNTAVARDQSKITDIPNQYDIIFVNSMARHAPNLDWRILKAVCYVESGFDAQKVSHQGLGGKGICQFLPRAWSDTPHFNKDIMNPHHNIDAAAFHLARLWEAWDDSDLTYSDQVTLTLASYNAGLRNIRRSHQLWTKNPKEENILHYLPEVTGNFSIGTIKYVEKVLQTYIKILSQQNATSQNSHW